ncbi:MAG: SOS response-associated peptidase [Bacteroidetes bacterium]|nr:SOS response-associated peptidase [Bacteroidota bacterium]
MCGRFALDYPTPVLSRWYKTKTMPELFPRYNIAPTNIILTIRDGIHGREGALMRWGLIPTWAMDGKKLPVHNNARAETIATKPLFKNAFQKQRCIIPASGFYEWMLLKDNKHKQPYYISINDGLPISFAGIWESSTINGVTVESCSIITTECNELMRPIHDRMPVMLPIESLDTWLKPEVLPNNILEFFLKPYASEQMKSWPVSTAVNRATNQGEQLIQSIN